MTLKMKVVLSFITFCVVMVSVSAGEFSKEDKKAKIEAFYKCIACGNQKVQDEYMKCHELKPKKCREIAEACEKEVMPGIEDMSERWNHVCSYPGTTGKIYDCIMTDENKKQLTAEDKEGLLKFKECAKEIYKGHCHKEES